MVARTKSLQAKASSVEADGNLRGIPGFGLTSQSRAMDETPIVLPLGVVTTVSAAASGLGSRPQVPFKATLVGLSYTVLTAAAATTHTHTLNLGTTVSAAGLVSGFRVDSGPAGTTVDVDLSGAVRVDLEKGEVLQVGASASAGFVASMTAIIVPRI